MITIIVKPVLIETKKIKQNILLLKDDNTLVHFNQSFYNIWKTHQIEPRNAIYTQLILISLGDETIKVGDIFYDTYSKNIGKVGEDTSKKVIAKKVIATHSQIPEIYIKQFIEEYNKGEVKDVEIEMNEYVSIPREHLLTGSNIEKKCLKNTFYKPRLLNGFINIVKIGNTFYTEIEVKELCETLFLLACQPDDKFYNNFKSFDHWFECSKK